MEAISCDSSVGSIERPILIPVQKIPDFRETPLQHTHTHTPSFTTLPFSRFWKLNPDSLCHDLKGQPLPPQSPIDQVHSICLVPALWMSLLCLQWGSPMLLDCLSSLIASVIWHFLLLFIWLLPTSCLFHKVFHLKEEKMASHYPKCYHHTQLSPHCSLSGLEHILSPLFHGKYLDFIPVWLTIFLPMIFLLVTLHYSCPCRW